MNMVMKHFEVASFTDAWIETAYIRARRDEILKSHLLQMRGLKQIMQLFQARNNKSHLLQMRGLKRRSY